MQSAPVCQPPGLSLCIVSHNAYGMMSGAGARFIGGVEWQTSLTARWFAAHGWPVSLLTWDEGGPTEERVDGVRIIKICRQDAGVPGLRFFHPKWTGLARAMRRAAADVYYHNCGECVTGQMAMWCRRHGRAFVFSAASEADCDPTLPELLALRERMLYRHGLKCADRVVVQTQTQHRRMREAFGVESVVIPMPCLGPADQEFSPPRRSTDRVLWIGRVCPVKRPDRLLELAAACPDLSIDLIGPVSDEAYAQATKRRAEQLPNVTLHGAVPRQRMDEFYRRGAVLCGTSEYEGFPNTFLEAWSHGLPVVSTFDPDGLIAGRKLGAAVKDIADMAVAVKKLLGSTEHYEEASRNARRYYAENHAVETVLPKFAAIFQEAAIEKAPRTP
ncbi:MAG: glycosyltransferase family 4 protein [Verrucomicrobia bacterium]|nr:glycosyltransferase family 4 protein [Verrucomicrobiota bacterium]